MTTNTKENREGIRGPATITQYHKDPEGRMMTVDVALPDGEIQTMGIIPALEYELPEEHVSAIKELIGHAEKVTDAVISRRYHKARKVVVAAEDVRMRIEEAARAERILVQVILHGTEDAETIDTTLAQMEVLEKARERIEEATAQVWKEFPH